MLGKHWLVSSEESNLADQSVQKSSSHTFITILGSEFFNIQIFVFTIRILLNEFQIYIFLKVLRLKISLLTFEISQ